MSSSKRNQHVRCLFFYVQILGNQFWEHTNNTSKKARFCLVKNTIHTYLPPFTVYETQITDADVKDLLDKLQKVQYVKIFVLSKRMTQEQIAVSKEYIQHIKTIIKWLNDNTKHSH